MITNSKTRIANRLLIFTAVVLINYSPAQQNRNSYGYIMNNINKCQSLKYADGHGGYNYHECR